MLFQSQILYNKVPLLVYVFLGEVTLLRDFVFILSEITDHQRVAVVSFDKDAFTPNSFYVPSRIFRFFWPKNVLDSIF
jgi:hypothetical protein